MFQANVPTRASAGTPSASSTPPNRRVRSVHSAIEVRLRSVAVPQTSCLSAVQPLEPVEDGGQGERVVLHQTSHGGLLAVVDPSL